MSGSISASGNIMSLLDKDCAITAIPTEYCFTNLFGGCGELTTSPELPATALNDYCYQGMFSHCYGLVEAPALPATVLSLGCYDLMFESCDNLSNISVSFTDWNGDSSTLNWVQDVAASGTFKCPAGLDTSTVDVDHVPAGWTVQH